MLSYNYTNRTLFYYKKRSKNMCQNETGGTTISIYINTRLVDELDKLVDKNKDIYRSTLISEAVAFWLENKKRKTA